MKNGFSLITLYLHIVLCWKSVSYTNFAFTILYTAAYALGGDVRPSRSDPP